MPKDISGRFPAPGLRRSLPAKRADQPGIRSEYSLRRMASQALLDLHRAPTDPYSVYERLLSSLAVLPSVQAAGVWRLTDDSASPVLLHEWPDGLSFDDPYPGRIALHCSADVEGTGSAIAVAVQMPEASAAVTYTRQAMCVLSRHGAIALAQRHNLLASQRTAGSLEVLNHIGNKIVSTLNLDELFRTVYQEISQVMTADVFYVALYDEPRMEVHMAFIYEEGRAVKPFTFALNDGPVSRVLKSGSATLYNISLREIPQAILFGRKPNEVRCIMLAPMVAKGRMIGAISVQSYVSGDFGQQDLDLLTTVAGQTAVAVENSVMYEKTLQQASTDAMTGLLNRQTFFAQLDKSIARAAETGGILSLIMVDSDSLKEINDRLGHREGDKHIAEMARVIRGNVRHQDIVCRYGGDEFLILLHHSTAPQAREVAERIRKSVAELSDPLDGTGIRPTVSAGIASYPWCGADAASLFQSADAAVYLSKRRGKNQVSLATDLDRGEARGYV